MESRGVGATLFFVVAAVVGVFAPLRSVRDSAGGSEASSVRRVLTDGPAPKTKPKPAGPVRGSDLVCEYVKAGADTVRRSIKDRPSACRGHVSIDQILIAVLPDPLDSHLDWAFDAALEAIRRGFERANYVPDRYWLPWRPTVDSSAAGLEQAAALRATAPGVILFRTSDTLSNSLALVYLVGETPTRGLQSVAFRAALADRASLIAAAPSLGWTIGRDRDLKHTLGIVGPILSGSARSLRRALDAADLPGITTVSIISGGATASSNAALLRCTPGETAFPQRCTGPMLTFAATVHPADTLLDRVEKMLQADFNIPRSRIAYLTEAGTQYGQRIAIRDKSPTTFYGRQTAFQATATPRTGDTGTARPSENIRGKTALAERPLLIPVPLNISRLRREYIRVTSPADTAGRNQTARTKLDWRDPSSATESPPPLSELTAPVIERTIDDIEQTLILHRIQAVGIIATDVRDRLFLASVVKERFRDVKLFFVGSHSLYLRPELNEQLRGALVVSTYPLFLENQFWDLGYDRDRQRMVFTSDLSEGTYNATVAQFGRDFDLFDYGYPLDTSWYGRPLPRFCAPPIWLSVIGSGSIAPLQAWKLPNVAQAPPSSYVYYRDCPRAIAHSDAEHTSAEEWFFTLLIACGFLGLCALVVKRALNELSRLGAWISAKLTRSAPLATSQVEEMNPRRDDEEASRARTAAADAPSDASTLRWARYQFALLLHEESWTIFLFTTIVCAFVPLALVVFRPQLHGLVPHAAVGGLIILLFLVSVTGLALLAAIGRDLARTGQFKGIGVRLSGWGKHLLLLAVALLYLTASALWLLRATGLLPLNGDKSLAALYVFRTLQLNSGLSPALPLLLGAAGLAIWSVAHLKRVRFLGRLSAFEAACDREKVSADQIAPAHQATPTIGIDRDTTSAGEEPLGTAIGFRRCIWAIRSGLLDLLPREEREQSKSADPISSRRRAGPRAMSVALLVGFLLFATWTVVQFEPTLEAAALSRGFPEPSAFDWLFRFLVISAMTFPAWSLFRLVIVWRALRTCMQHVEAIPLGGAFERLPKSIASMTRFAPFTPPSSSALDLELDRAACIRWLRLEPMSTAANAQGEVAPAVALDPDASSERGASRPAVPLLRSDSFAFEAGVETAFSQLYGELIGTMKQRDAYLVGLSEQSPSGGSTPPQNGASNGGGNGEPSLRTAAATSARDSHSRVLHHVAVREHETVFIEMSDVATMPPAPKPAAGEQRVLILQELVALYVVDYIEWVVRQLRQLALSLIIALTLTTLLLTSYPFEPASLLKTLFFILIGLSVASIASILFQMNRNATLSRITHTAAGEVTWNWQFGLNLALVIGVPLVTVLSAQFPEVRDFLFAWVTPIMKSLGKV